MKTLAQSIMEHAKAQSEGTILSAKELLHFGSRAGVDQALSRLAAGSSLLRAGRGLYVLPVNTRFGSHPPATAKVVSSVAAQKGAKIVHHGAMAANSLGLTTQVPTSPIYVTTGRSRTLRLGHQTVELRHAPAWQFAAAGLAGEAMRALAWLGEKHGQEAVATLRLKLPSSERAALLQARPRMPGWMAEQVSALA